jgi:DNA recombination protein RmuC
MILFFTALLMTLIILLALLAILFIFHQKMRLEYEKHMDDLKDQLHLKLSENTEKTSVTFTDVIKRLALIDQAQKKMDDLSSEVLTLNRILNDRKARGAFGEIQLHTLLQNMLPQNHYLLQASLSNGTRVDCLLLLPEPTGKLAIDAKFPLENYRRLLEASSEGKKPLEQAFTRDIKKHILDIAQKYIIPGETAPGAILFLPAESIFADIHNDFPDLIDFAHQNNVWLTSPTTMMAVLTTLQAILKDQATKEHIHIIREHLQKLREDFERWGRRMDQLQRHVALADQDAKEVQISARKIGEQFQKIENVEF